MLLIKRYFIKLIIIKYIFHFIKDHQEIFEINQKYWDRKTPAHIDSPFLWPNWIYRRKKHIKTHWAKATRKCKGKIHSSLVMSLWTRFHVTIKNGRSRNRVDFSASVIQKAKEFSNKLDLDTQFICCNIHDLANHLNQQFDPIFKGYEVIGWLPDLGK